MCAYSCLQYRLSSLISGVCMVSVDSLCLLCAVICADVLSGNMLHFADCYPRQKFDDRRRKNAESIDTPTCVYSAVRLSGQDTRAGA